MEALITEESPLPGEQAGQAGTVAQWHWHGQEEPGSGEGSAEWPTVPLVVGDHISLEMLVSWLGHLCLT